MFLVQTQNLDLMVIHRILWHKDLTQNRCLFYILKSYLWLLSFHIQSKLTKKDPNNTFESFLKFYKNVVYYCLIKNSTLLF